MPWKDLTAPQQNFLNQFVVKEMFDFLSDVHARSENLDMTTSFEGLEALLAEIKQRIDGLPNDYGEKATISEQLIQVNALREAGHFEEASQKAAPLLQQAERTLQVISQQVAGLTAVTDAPVAIDGALGEEIARLDPLRLAIRNTLGAEVPAKADLTTARVAQKTYEDACSEVTAAAKERSDAAAAFKAIFDLANPKLEAIAALKADLYKLAPSHGALVEAIAAAASQLKQAAAAATDASKAAHEKATVSLTEWMKTEAEAAALAPKAAAEIKTELKTQYEDLRAWLEDLAVMELDLFMDADIATLTPLQLAIKKDVADMAPALAGTDTALHVAMLAALGAIGQRGDAFEAAGKNASANLLTAKLGTLGVPASRSKALITLGEADQDAFELVGEMLKKTAGILKNAEVTTDFVAEKTRLANEADKVWDDAWAAYKGAEKGLKAAKEGATSLQQEQAVLEKQISEAGDPTPPEMSDKLATLKLSVVAKEAEAKTLETTVAEKKQANSDARRAFTEVEKVASAAEKQKQMLDAICYGPLSQDNGRAVDDATRLSLLKVMDDDFKIGAEAIKLTSQAEHPDAVVRCAEAMCTRVGDRFKVDSKSRWSESQSRDYAEKLMAMSGNFPAGVVDDLIDYLDQGRHREGSPEIYSGKSFNEDLKKRTNLVSDALLDDHGAFDLDKGSAALQDVMFHPASLKYPTPAQCTHMMDTLDYLRGSRDARDKITSVSKPAAPGALALIKSSTGKEANTQSDGDARQAVLSALMTPVYQGSVGSCFATAGIVRMRNTDPDMALDTYMAMAATGTYTPAKGVAVPVVQKVPADEDPLVRSLEYSAATACARAQDSMERRGLDRAAAKGVDTMEASFDTGKWAVTKLKIDAAISDALTFRYNPEAETELADDGSSSKGCYELLNKTSKEKIKDKAGFISAVSAAVLATLSDEDLAENVTKSDIEALIAGDAFQDAMKRTEQKNGADADFMPWQLESGGATDAATETILGGNIRTRGMLSSANPDTSDESQRSEQVISAFLETYGDRNDNMATMRTVGQHGFNALPSHPSLEPLKKGGRAKFAHNLQTELLDKGAALKDTELTSERAAYMFDQEMATLHAAATGDAKAALESAMSVHRPSAAMKPAAFKTLIKTATAEYVDKKAAASVDRWKSGLKKKGDPDPDEPVIAKKLAASKESWGKAMDNLAYNRLVRDLGAPEFVIADTNWGSGQKHTFFVFVADPTTGKPKLFKRDDPPGTLSAVDKKWVDKQWARVE
jgi:hypothetical protein